MLYLETRKEYDSFMKIQMDSNIKGEYYWANADSAQPPGKFITLLTENSAVELIAKISVFLGYSEFIYIL